MGKMSTAAPPTPFDSFQAAAAEHPGSAALIDADGVLRYRELDQEVRRLAAFLSDHGVAGGDRVAICAQNERIFPVAVLAAWWLGAMVVPVNPMYRDTELRHIFADCAPAALVFSAETEVAGLGTALRGLVGDCVVVTSARESGVGTPLAALPADQPPAPLPAAGPALLTYTSGTSGKPKGAVNSHANLGYVADMLKRWTGLEQGSRVFALAPLFHITGLAVELSWVLRLHGALILDGRFSPSSALASIRRHRPRMMSGTSTAFYSLMNAPEYAPEALQSLEVLFAGGAPLPVAVWESMRASTGLSIVNGWGLTETTGPCVLMPMGEVPPLEPGYGALSVGVAMPGVELRIARDDGTDAPVGEAGEILTRGPGLMLGYWSAAHQGTVPVGTWFATGDIGLLDERERLYIVDRKKDMINASGFKVWPREVEDVLYSYPGVREVAVIGVPDPYRGETVLAYAAVTPGVTAEDLTGYCRAHLAAFKVPRTIRLLPELPKTASGKILRRDLRRLWQREAAEHEGTSGRTRADTR